MFCRYDVEINQDIQEKDPNKLTLDDIADIACFQFLLDSSVQQKVKDIMAKVMKSKGAGASKKAPRAKVTAGGCSGSSSSGPKSSSSKTKALTDGVSAAAEMFS